MRNTFFAAALLVSMSANQVLAQEPQKVSTHEDVDVVTFLKHHHNPIKGVGKGMKKLGGWLNHLNPERYRAGRIVTSVAISAFCLTAPGGLCMGAQGAHQGLTFANALSTRGSMAAFQFREAVSPRVPTAAEVVAAAKGSGPNPRYTLPNGIVETTSIEVFDQPEYAGPQTFQGLDRALAGQIGYDNAIVYNEWNGLAVRVALTKDAPVLYQNAGDGVRILRYLGDCTKIVKGKRVRWFNRIKLDANLVAPPVVSKTEIVPEEKTLLAQAPPPPPVVVQAPPVYITQAPAPAAAPIPANTTQHVIYEVVPVKRDFAAKFKDIGSGIQGMGIGTGVAAAGILLPGAIENSAHEHRMGQENAAKATAEATMYSADQKRAAAQYRADAIAASQNYVADQQLAAANAAAAASVTNTNTIAGATVEASKNAIDANAALRPAETHITQTSSNVGNANPTTTVSPNIDAHGEGGDGGAGGLGGSSTAPPITVTASTAPVTTKVDATGTGNGGVATNTGGNVKATGGNPTANGGSAKGGSSIANGGESNVTNKPVTTSTANNKGVSSNSSGNKIGSVTANNKGIDASSSSQGASVGSVTSGSSSKSNSDPTVITKTTGGSVGPITTNGGDASNKGVKSESNSKATGDTGDTKIDVTTGGATASTGPIKNTSGSNSNAESKGNSQQQVAKGGTGGKADADANATGGKSESNSKGIGTGGNAEANNKGQKVDTSLKTGDTSVKTGPTNVKTDVKSGGTKVNVDQKTGDTVAKVDADLTNVSKNNLKGGDQTVDTKTIQTNDNNQNTKVDQAVKQNQSTKVDSQNSNEANAGAAANANAPQIAQGHDPYPKPSHKGGK